MSTVAIAAPQGVINNLFTSLPESEEQTPAGALGHISDYASTTSGAWDVFRVVDLICTLLKKIPIVGEGGRTFLTKAAEVANTSGIALSIPSIFSDLNALKSSIARVFSVSSTPHSDPLRTQKITQAYKKSFLDGMSLTNSLSQAALFLDRAKVYVLNPLKVRVTDGIYNLTSVVMDGADLITQCFKLKHFYSGQIQPRNETEQGQLDSKKTLSWMCVARNVASLGSAAIALVGIVFGVAVEGIAFLAGVSLALGAVWLTLKIATYFYEKIIVEGSRVPLSTTLSV